MMATLRSLTVAAPLIVCLSGALAASELVVKTASGGSHRFMVEDAADERSREVGLMFRDHLAQDGGMLFDFGPLQRVAMWMKNTLIPLDILFLANDGRIVYIAERTVPHSLTPIGPPEPVRAVLEINGGQASRLGITVGDKVRHPMFAEHY